MDQQLPVTWQDSFSSQLGWIAWQGNEKGVQQLTLGHPDQQAALRSLPRTSALETDKKRPNWFALARRTLERYCQGEPADLAEIPVDICVTTPFAQSVIRTLLTVGYGRTVSYLELAEMAGSPRAARAVGTVMSRNTVPLIIPCHRVVGAGGRLGGYSAPRGLDMKRLLLDMEATHSPALATA